jgi:phage-related protein
MAVFDWVESAATALEEAPEVARSRFGDGYEQRAPAGLNPLAQRWRVRFTAVEDAVADQIVAFLRARGGVEAFDWTPPRGATALRFLCPRWSRSLTDTWGESDVDAEFEQVFEP